jgi:hypothetical protein
MLLGLFGVPVALLVAGHRVRRRSPRVRGAFWGAVWGHLLVIGPVCWVSMVPAAMWSADDRARGVIGLWALLVGPAIGSAIGAFRRA